MKIEQLELVHERMGLTFKQAAELFDRFDVWGFIDKAYEGLHVQGALATYDDVVEYIANRRGGVVGAVEVEL
jgi:hypothetical protein